MHPPRAGHAAHTYMAREEIHVEFKNQRQQAEHGGDRRKHTGFAGVSMEIGKLLLGVFLALAVISFIISLATGKRSTFLP